MTAARGGVADGPILLTGVTGQLGHALQPVLERLAPVAAVGRVRCDLEDAASVRATLERIRPAMIVHPAAYTAVDRAESEPERAHAANVRAVEEIGRYAAASGCPTILYSTDYVFDGRKPAPYVEDDPTAPIGVYGRTKRDGEDALRAATPRHLILRTSWVVGNHGQNFIRTMLRLARERDALRVVDDQVGAPTSTALLAAVTARLLERLRRDGVDAFPFGTYHLTAGGETSWHGLARRVIARAAAAGIPLRTSPDRVEPIPTAAYPTPARRPANSRLDTTKLRTTFDLALPDWTEGADAVCDDLMGT